MPLWMPRVETRLYRFIARLTARQLGKLESVLSVYARRSVACGEVVFGGSDIDIHILVKPSFTLDHEARWIRDLAARYARLKRRLPYVGDCNVSTMAELEHWYRDRPFTWYRDRGWLKLHGEEWTRPEATLDGDDARDTLLWWFFWAWERLPGFFRSGNIRSFCNLFLDMVNAYGLYVGALHAPVSRTAVLRYWRTLCPPSLELETLSRGFTVGFRGRYRSLLPWLYRESLKLGEALSAHVNRTLDGSIRAIELHSRTPFSFAARTYVLVDSFREEELARALEAMRKRADVFLTTEKVFKLYLYHRNPWEYYLLPPKRLQQSLTPPPEEALRRFMRFMLHKEVPRSAGFSIGRRVNRTATVGFQYAQFRLYAERGAIATSAEELRRQYQHHYGVWPYAGGASRDSYFLRDYPVICRIIEEIAQQETFSKSAPRSE